MAKYVKINYIQGKNACQWLHQPESEQAHRLKANQPTLAHLSRRALGLLPNLGKINGVWPLLCWVWDLNCLILGQIPAEPWTWPGFRSKHLLLVLQALLLLAKMGLVLQNMKLKSELVKKKKQQKESCVFLRAGENRGEMSSSNLR